jgi:hypothetical protein
VKDKVGGDVHDPVELRFAQLHRQKGSGRHDGYTCQESQGGDALK